MLFENYFKQAGEFKNLELTLDRINNALNEINFHENTLGQIIHIAGTNGKGSTAFFLSQLLMQDAFNVSLFTSPHIFSVTERIKLNDKPVTEKIFDEIFETNFETIKKHNLSYFETLTFIGFVYFSQNNPDFSIIETGMGGQFDSTNVLNHKIPVITKITSDHENWLGKNIYGIINEKIAIVKNNKILFLGYNHDFITNYIKAELKSINIINVIENDFLSLKSDFPPVFQQNLVLAIKIYKYLTKSNPDISNLTLPPCRNEKIGKFLFDGAHNPNAFIEFTKNLSKNITVICSFTKDRDVKKMINILKKKTDKIYLTEIPSNDRSINIKDFSDLKVKLIKNPKEALDKAIENNLENDIIITGSLYLCGYLKKYVTEKYFEP